MESSVDPTRTQDVQDVETQNDREHAKRERSFSRRQLMSQLLSNFISLILTALTLGLPAWACVQYGEGIHTIPQQCSARVTEHGFEGLPDFYGLGIRLGMYVQ